MSMMAAFDFGDAELFEQLEEKSPLSDLQSESVNDGEDSDQLRNLRRSVEDCKKTIERLSADNEELKRKLNVLSRPTGIKVDNSKTDWPLCQINYGNSVISKQCRQEIEDFIFSLVRKCRHDSESSAKGSASNLKPHLSSFIMEENYKAKTSETPKHLREAFSVVGSVLYFADFCVDKLGQPLLNGNPQQTDGWEIPKYQQVFDQVIGLEGQEFQLKDKRPRPCCFNCSSEDHHLRDCPEPKDMARINEKRQEFLSNSQSNQRYHAEEVEERFAKYKPGIVSQELLEALGINATTLPPFIYRMRELGYPPGWLKEAEMENSGLTVYDDSHDKAHSENESQSQKVSYDVSQLVDFPGFNVSTPASIRDDYRSFGSIPMQPQHWKQNYAAFLTSTFPSPDSSSAKRRHQSDPAVQQTKKRKTNPDRTHGSDMDIESDSDGVLKFFLPSPPPLPLGTPPATPIRPPVPKGTPPPTPPTKDSPSTLVMGGSMGEESEDGLTLEELEEQQRLLWEALAKADNATSSDSEASVFKTPVAKSPSLCSSLKLDTEGEDEKILSTPTSPVEETAPSSVEEPETGSKDTVVGDSNSIEMLEQTEQTNSQQLESSDVIVLNDLPEDNHSAEAVHEESPQIITHTSNTESSDLEEPKAQTVMMVPHRSKFAAGIIPFEDTPEFTEVAEATGTYIRIRDLLKSSPRNQAKSKK